MNLRPALVGLLALVALSGCSPNEAAPAPPTRPVLSVVATPRDDATISFTGTVQPRFSRDLGFRVLGRVVARDVDVGQTVKAGQLLASLDPMTLSLAVRQIEAELAKAEAQLVYATATKDRKKALLAQKVASQADLDTAEEALATANAAVVRARAGLDKAKEQLSYTRLVSDTDGIVTAVNAEVGQTVNAGDTVVTVAQAEIREAMVDVPDEMAQSLKVGDPFATTLQVDPGIAARGRVREIAPQADAATRTRRIRITLDAPPPTFRIGTTVTATPSRTELASIDLPPSALLKADGRSFVWVVDEKALTVSRKPVEVASDLGGTLRIKSGIDAGARVVTAGVNSLAEGQRVRIDPEMIP
ncbi:efflux RND transporter periplasmic adaptor subunit [Starkeya sp. ORNL1]|uniref:efflux RND transporter periplasmic adaptor subunit n=1 Tax=Starkeya sp. ORNL1 TaxID=2709380 RepID=UPI001463E634|nr:efflux RND transporter periplasmic adaptor subunit [Starkeya sp. ORNL1]QJP16686.1 efflux RND transporter periplasmic adaptor subunit [Starkeya sp. ORNL1]